MSLTPRRSPRAAAPALLAILTSAVLGALAAPGRRRASAGARADAAAVAWAPADTADDPPRAR